MKRLALLSLLALTLLSCKSGANTSTNGAADNPAPVTTMVNEFKADKDKANEKYRLKTLTIRGKVKKVGLDVDEKGSILNFETPSGDATFQCLFPQQQTAAVMKLQPGQDVTVSGEFIDVDGSVIYIQLDNCTLR